MISFLRGTVESVGENYAVLDVNGVGYYFSCSMTTVNELTMVSDEVKVYTHMTLSDMGVFLYGFISRAEKEIFLKLTSVSKVGGKVALSILSLYTPSEVILSIVSGDIKALSRASGVGKKLAESIIFNLKDKFDVEGGLNLEGSDEVNSEYSSEVKNEAVLALVSLGFDRSFSIKTVNNSYEENISCEELISRCLICISE